MQKYAVVVLDATGSMAGQEQRVVTSANEYVKTLPEDTHLTVFMFDSERWLTFFEGEATSWAPMKREDYSPGAMTPLYDAVGRAIIHVEGLVSDGDRVMMMVDTDGYENASQEHTQESIKAMVEQRKEAGWAFMLMSQGLDRVVAEDLAAQGSAVGMSSQPAVYSARASNYARASAQTAAYFEDGEQPADGEILDEEEGDGTEQAQEGRSPARSAPFWPENWRRHS